VRRSEISHQEAVYGSVMVHRLVSVLEQSLGVYGTAPTCYLSALARVPHFSIASFDAAIAGQMLVRIRAMRYSVYTLPVGMVAMVAAATRSIGRKQNVRRRRIERRYERLSLAIEEALAGGPRAASELRDIVDPEHELDDELGIVIGTMLSDFRLVRATSTGTWRSDRYLYARWADWIPEVDPEAIGELDAKRELVERYVAAYGPVTLDDVKWWTGWTKTESLEAADGIDLARTGDAAVLLEGTRLLPVWDALMVAYRKRDRLLDPSFAPLVYDRYGNATSVVLDDGRAVGQWDLGSADSPLALKVAPFEEWSPARWDRVEEQANLIATLAGAASVTVTRLEEPTDLLDSSRNRFLAPLSRR
ncbi:MAG: crosslink repair DNA glycosylase YcaQ family protein, partial [Acidimicrobiia bacterium]